MSEIDMVIIDPTASLFDADGNMEPPPGYPYRFYMGPLVDTEFACGNCGEALIETLPRDYGAFLALGCGHPLQDCPKCGSSVSTEITILPADPKA
jgi:hypothetical protein